MEALLQVMQSKVNSEAEDWAVEGLLYFKASLSDGICDSEMQSAITHGQTEVVNKLPLRANCPCDVRIGAHSESTAISVRIDSPLL